jgi:hypothetical protein
MWRTVFILLFGFILMFSFAHVVDNGFNWRFITSAIMSSVLVGYLFATKND